MRGFVSGIFGAAKSQEPEAPQQQPPKEPVQSPQTGQSGEVNQAPVDPAASIAGTSGFNLSGVNQPTAPETQDATQAASSAPPGLFAGLGFAAAPTAPAQAPQPNQPEATNTAQSTSQLPGLFAGLGFGAAPAEPPKEENTYQPVDIFSQINLMTPPAQDGNKPEGGANSFQNPYSSGGDAGSNPMQMKPPGAQEGMQPPTQAAPQQPNAFGLFGGMSTRQSVEEQKAAESKPANTPSAFDFMSGVSNPQPNAQVAANIFGGMQAPATEAQAPPTAPAETPVTWGAQPTEAPKPPADAPTPGLSGLGLFSGMSVGAAPQQPANDSRKQSQDTSEPPKQVWGAPQSQEASADVQRQQSSASNSGFSFIASPSTEQQAPSIPQYGQSTQEQQPANAFSFMANMGSSQPDIVQTAPPVQQQPAVGKEAQFGSGRKDSQADPFIAQDISNDDLLGTHPTLVEPPVPETPAEPVLDSREVIEDKIFSIKCRMIDFTVRQWDISSKIQSLKSDISLLQNKISEFHADQSQAIETEDYDTADNLDMQIKQTTKLVEAKEYQIKNMEENSQSQEVMKADRLQELSELMHKSISNLIIIRKKQVGELKDYKKREEKTIKQRKEALAKESIRIAEDQKSYAGEKLEVDNLLKEIEDKVYADTKEQHEEKYKLDEMIDDLNKDIEELMRVLDRKRKEKEMLELEKQVHERKIDQARMGYRGEIEQSQEQLDRVTARIGHTELALATFDKDTKDLEEFQIEFTNTQENYREEFIKLEEMEAYLTYTAGEIDQTNEEKKEIRNKQNEVENQKQNINLEKAQIQRGREFILERLSKLELETEEHSSQIQHNSQKVTRLEGEKKKFAQAKKFKEAGKCQAEIKEAQAQKEYLASQMAKTEEHKVQIDEDLKQQTEQIAGLEAQLKELALTHQKNQQVILTYRKDEILDLLSSLTKAEARISEAVTNELSLKKEKLQSELTQIDDELFDLEKRYGEFKRPKREKKVVVKEKQVAEEDSEAEASEKEETQEMAIPTYGEPEAAAETEEVEIEIEEKIEAGIDLSLSKSEMLKFIQEYHEKVASLEQQVDEAAEAEDYDKAEELQNELDQHLEKNSQKVEQYQEKVDTMGDEEELPEVQPEAAEVTPEVIQENDVKEVEQEEVRDEADVKSEEAPYEPPALNVIPAEPVQEEKSADFQIPTYNDEPEEAVKEEKEQDDPSDPSLVPTDGLEYDYKTEGNEVHVETVTRKSLTRTETTEMIDNLCDTQEEEKVQTEELQVEEKQEEPKIEETIEAAPVASAFGFLSQPSTTTAADESQPPVAAPSAFGFMASTTPAEPEAAAEQTEIPAPANAFAFMAPPEVQESQEEQTMEDKKEEEAYAPPAFSFMAGPSMVPQEAEVEEAPASSTPSAFGFIQPAADATVEEQAPAATSAFGFIQPTPPADSPAASGFNFINQSATPSEIKPENEEDESQKPKSSFGFI